MPVEINIQGPIVDPMTKVIFDDLGFPEAEEMVSPNDVTDALAAAAGQDVDVLIYSPGGSATASKAVYDSIRRYARDNAATVRTYARTDIASGATSVFMAGTERIMAKGATLHIHKASTPLTRGRGTEDDHKETAKELALFDEGQLQIYKEAPGSRVTDVQLASMLTTAGTTIRADRAIALGLASAEEDYQAKSDDLKVAANTGGISPDQVAAMMQRMGITFDTSQPATPAQTQPLSMDPKAIRQALGLDANVSNEQVISTAKDLNEKTTTADPKAIEAAKAEGRAETVKAFAADLDPHNQSIITALADAGNVDLAIDHLNATNAAHQTAGSAAASRSEQPAAGQQDMPPVDFRQILKQAQTAQSPDASASEWKDIAEMPPERAKAYCKANDAHARKLYGDFVANHELAKEVDFDRLIDSNAQQA